MAGPRIVRGGIRRFGVLRVKDGTNKTRGSALAVRVAERHGVHVLRPVRVERNDPARRRTDIRPRHDLAGTEHSAFRRISGPSGKAVASRRTRRRKRNFVGVDVARRIWRNRAVPVVGIIVDAVLKPLLLGPDIAI